LIPATRKMLLQGLSIRLPFTVSDLRDASSDPAGAYASLTSSRG
jgi:hypothetical protein